MRSIADTEAVAESRAEDQLHAIAARVAEEAVRARAAKVSEEVDTKLKNELEEERRRGAGKTWRCEVNSSNQHE